MVFSRPTQSDWKLAKQLFTQQSIRWAVSSFNPYKTPGADGIRPVILQQGDELITPHLVGIMRDSFALAYIPTVWRRAQVVFIPKIGKKDYSLPKSYRPISLTSFALKAMEKIIDNEIRSKALRSMPLHQNQHAYRAGKSTDTALYQLCTEIQSAFDCEETVLCAFLDIEGAFDNASHSGVCRALEKRNVQRPICKWVESLLQTRIAEAATADSTIQLHTSKGCPQGGVLSPLLWSLLVDDLLHLLTNNGIRCQGYADDVVIIARGKFENTLCDILQRALNLTKRWCAGVGLDINPSKTAIIPFTRKRVLPGMREISMDGVAIKLVSEVKYLGLILDAKLNWKRHADATLSKATKALMICKRLAGKSWGCSPGILRWMYIMIIRPMVTYGAVAWASRAALSTVRTALTKLQRLACVCITGAMRTCPTAAMEVMLELTPLHIVIQQSAKRTLLNITREGFGKGKVMSSKNMEALSQQLPLTQLPRDDITKVVKFEKKFRIELDDKVNWSTPAFKRKLQECTLHWYTDGSKTPEGIGAGIYGPRTKRSVPMGSFPSIFQAEVYAICLCAEINLERNFRNERIAILSDSQAALRALSSCEIKSSLVLECIEKLNQLGTHNRIRLIWVPGHRGIPGNEVADALAREAAASSLIGPEPFLAMGQHTIKEKLRNEELRLREISWHQTMGLRQAKSLLGGYNQKRFRKLISLPKDSLRMLTGILTGHCRLRSHLHMIGIWSTDSCRFCDQSQETPTHLLLECSAIARRRLRHLGYLQPEEKHIRSIQPNSILSLVRELGLDEVL